MRGALDAAATTADPDVLAGRLELAVAQARALESEYRVFCQTQPDQVTDTTCRVGYDWLFARAAKEWDKRDQRWDVSGEPRPFARAELLEELNRAWQAAAPLAAVTGFAREGFDARAEEGGSSEQRRAGVARGVALPLQDLWHRPGAEQVYLEQKHRDFMVKAFPLLCLGAVGDPHRPWDWEQRQVLRRGQGDLGRWVRYLQDHAAARHSEDWNFTYWALNSLQRRDR